MENYNRIHLFLDRDPMGIKSTRQALEWSSKYLDQSRYYKEFKDLNEYLVNSASQEIKQKRKRGMRL